MWLYLLIIVLILISLPRLTRALSKRSSNVRVAFLHPYCNAGGGGERVLWVWVRALQEQQTSSSKKVSVVIYTGDKLPGKERELCGNVKTRFNLEVDPSFMRMKTLRTRWLVEASTWPRFTLLGQSLGSVLMAIEAIVLHTPDVLIDSMGYSFAVAVFKVLLGCKTCSYVHYPTISTDMIDLVDSGQSAHNNAKVIASYPTLKKMKLMYYRLFARLYGVMGRRSDLVLTNSSWTHAHINKLWRVPDRTFIVYPPCDLKNFFTLKLERHVPPYYIISVAQFRPEKDHALQIRAFRVLMDKLERKYPDFPRSQIVLDIVGSVRNGVDEKLLQGVRDLSVELNVDENVQFSKNVSFDELMSKLQRSIIGLHTMWNEHFGIGVVEMMASGCTVIAHNSGGPKMDIVCCNPPFVTGFLAQTPESYASAMLHCLMMKDCTRCEIASRARSSLSRFSQETFNQSVGEKCALMAIL